MSILERDARNPLFGWEPRAFVDELNRRLRGRAEAAYIFGSFGTPSFGRDSDVEMAIDTLRRIEDTAVLDQQVVGRALPGRIRDGNRCGRGGTKKLTSIWQRLHRYRHSGAAAGAGTWAASMWNAAAASILNQSSAPTRSTTAIGTNGAS